VLLPCRPSLAAEALAVAVLPNGAFASGGTVNAVSEGRAPFALALFRQFGDGITLVPRTRSSHDLRGEQP